MEIIYNIGLYQTGKLLRDCFMSILEEWSKLEIDDNLNKEIFQLETYLIPASSENLERKNNQLKILDYLILNEQRQIKTFLKTKRLSLMKIKSKSLWYKRKLKLLENIKLGNEKKFLVNRTSFPVEASNKFQKLDIPLRKQRDTQPVQLQQPVFLVSNISKLEIQFMLVEHGYLVLKEPLTSLGSLRVIIEQKGRISNSFKNMKKILAACKKEELCYRKFKVIVNIAMLQQVDFLDNLQLLEIYERDFYREIPSMQIGPNSTLKFVFNAHKNLISYKGLITIIVINDRVPSKIILEDLTMFRSPFYFISNFNEFYSIAHKLTLPDKVIPIQKFESCHERYLVRTFGIDSYQAHSLLQKGTLKEILMRILSSHSFK
jgi:hypothetical protein